MQQDPVHTQTHWHTHRLGGDGGLACNRIHPLAPSPHPIHTFMLTRGKRKSLRLISGASAPTPSGRAATKSPQGVTERGQGPRDGGSTRGSRVVGGTKAEEGQWWPTMREEQGNQNTFMCHCTVHNKLMKSAIMFLYI